MMNKNWIISLVLAGVALSVTSCGREESDVAEIRQALTIDEAINHPSRPEQDRADDGSRRPDRILEFVGIEPGDTVFEIEAGAGYYTELFSRLVGPEGQVIMQSPAEFDKFFSDRQAERLRDNRLANVRLSNTLFDDLDAEDNSVDVVTWILGPHELYYRPIGVETLGDPAGAFAEIKRILKPDGVFLVIDHSAPAGAPTATGNTTHRIDPYIVKKLARDAGLHSMGESLVLRNLDDDVEMNVFDPAVRRRTNRFVIKYKTTP